MNFDHIAIRNHNRQQQQQHPNDFTTTTTTTSTTTHTVTKSSSPPSPFKDDNCSYFDEYDDAMEAVRYEADLQDYYYYYNYQQDDEQDTSMLCYVKEKKESQHAEEYDDHKEKTVLTEEEEEEEEEEDGASSVDASYNNDALLYLILGVQSYISEMSNTGFMNEQDSPLFELQYKMYNYMKQRACEMGFDVDSLPPPPR